MKKLIPALVLLALSVAYVISGYPADYEAPRQYGYIWQMPNYWVNPSWLEVSHGKH